MNRHMINITSVALKDLRQLWPLALITSVFVLAHTLGTPVVSNALHNAALLCSGVLIVVLIQQDSPASVRHDWLTRPLGGLDVLLAKFLFAGAAILVPALFGSVVFALRHGNTLHEATVLAIIAMGPNLMGAFMLILIAAVTSAFAQTAGVLAALVALQMFVNLAAGRVISSPAVPVALIGGVIVLWLQYKKRRTAAARGVLSATVGIVASVIALLASSGGNAQGQPTPHATTAIDGIMDAFKSHPLVGIGDAHGMAQEQDFYSALVTDPRFGREVGNVVVEFGNAARQAVMDRFMNGEDVSYTELRKVWTDPVGWAPPPAYLGFVNFLAQIRATNLVLPRELRIHVWLGDPPLDWSKVQKREDVGAFPGGLRDSWPAELIQREILGKGKKALVIYGGFHFNRDSTLQAWIGPQPSMAMIVEERNPGAFFVIGPYPGFQDKACAAAFEKDKQDWRAPFLVSPVRGTALDDAQFRLRCPMGTLHNTPDLMARMQRLMYGMDGDAMLYLGPTTSLTHSPMLPDSYLDEPYRKEILRHWNIFGMRGEEADLGVADNPASPQPFGY